MIFTPLATDAFTGTDLAELGANWDSGYTGHIALQILSNQCRASTFNTTAKETYNAVALPNDQYAQFVIAAAFGGENLIGVTLRATAPATDTMYFCHTSKFTSGTVVANEITKIVAGAWTQLAVDSTITAWATNDVLKGAVLGTGLYLFQNGTEVLSASDSALTSGRAGLAILWFGSGSADTKVDNWEAGEVEAEAGFLAAWAMRSNIVVVGTP